MNTKITIRAPSFIRFGLIFLLLSLMAGCATPLGQQYGLVGGIAGCAAGAALGGGARGCVAGGALGGAAGGAYGDHESRRQGGNWQGGRPGYDGRYDYRDYDGRGYQPYCQDVAVYDNWGRFRGYRRVCR